MSNTTIRLTSGDCDDLVYLLRLSIRVLGQGLDQDIDEKDDIPSDVFSDYSETEHAQAMRILDRSGGILESVMAAREGESDVSDSQTLTISPRQAEALKGLLTFGVRAFTEEVAGDDPDLGPFEGIGQGDTQDTAEFVVQTESDLQILLRSSSNPTQEA
ncbi:hypothetical protein [Thioalkalivibrio sp. ALE16]|uniref:hypothetical protein n=1 Tax=Thioalkalivibrio sp. ALE16 TaxID=1158172 RepID=UPI00037F448E|nr:hypothetical protein [Thioalkalivibrio sp. ALE16]